MGRGKKAFRIRDFPNTDVKYIEDCYGVGHEDYGINALKGGECVQ